MLNVKRNLALLNSLMLMTTALITPMKGRAATPSVVERPPQYVVLAFDGSYNNGMWNYLLNFSNDFEKQNSQSVKFTFFINPVYVVQHADRAVYTAPGGKHGSAIGWGDNQEGITRRLQYMNQALESKHEIGSHAVGHWDGSTWSYEDWKSELTQFDSILDRVFDLNHINPAVAGGGLAFRPTYPNYRPENKIVGFRAPQLGTSEGMYKALPEFGIQYDTSQIAGGMSYWPQKTSGGWWNFPLGRIPISGTAKHYPTMDYNFCANDTIELLKRNPTLAHYSFVDPVSQRTRGNDGIVDCLTYVPLEVKAEMKQRALNSYLNYFRTNYYGARAPISIGHHFSEWMGGAYFEAMMEVASEVCKLPEVKCVTNKELMAYLENPQTQAQMSAIRAGRFEKLASPKETPMATSLDLQASLRKQGDRVVLKLGGVDAHRSGLSSKIFVGSQAMGTQVLDLKKIRAQVVAGEKIRISASVFDRRGHEVLSVTHDLENVGQPQERLSEKSLEELNVGDLPAAHREAQTERFN